MSWPWPLIRNSLGKVKGLNMLVLIIFIFSFSVCAAGKGSEIGQVKDLISPFINFMIFIGILYWALKESVKNHFSSYGSRISTFYKQAQTKKKQADGRLNECEAKMKNLLKETSQIFAQAEKDARNFGNEYQNEVKSRIENLSTDSLLRLKAEEASLINQLNKELLDAVLRKAKSSLNKESSLKSKVTENLIRELP